MALLSKVKPEAIEGLSTVFHFDMGDAGTYTVSLDNGQLKVAEGLSGEAACSVKASEDTLGKVVSGDQNAMMAMMTGKLKISNLSEMMKYAKIFGFM